MGVMCSKPLVVDDSHGISKERFRRKTSLNKRPNSSRREEIVRSKDKLDGSDAKVMLIDKKENGSKRFYDYSHKIEKLKIDDQIEMKKTNTENYEVNVINHPGIGRLPKPVEAEHVAAGWPSWLAVAAGEAIKGWIPRRANTFEKLDKIGQGTYSNVYRARDVIHDKVVALKKVRFDNHDPESVKFMAREIAILRRLDHPNVIKLEGLIASPTSSSLYLVFEYMEHDLVGLASRPGIKFTEPQVKCYMKQLLSGLDHCHSHGVLHRDIKGSNLLIDDNGILKIADFGLASKFDPNERIPMTSRVVTLWYRPPELLLGVSHYGVAVDLWSTGCILGELFAGKPILPGKTEVEQLHRIFKLCGSPSDDYWRKLKLRHSTAFKPIQPYKCRVAETFKDFPASALRLMESFLSIDPAHRGTAADALNSEFFTTQPFACEPLSLPKYPPSKEIDAKLQDEESRRHGAAGGRDHRGDLERSRSKKSAVNPAPNVNALQKRHNTISKSGRTEMLISNKDATYVNNPSKQRQSLKEKTQGFLDHQRRQVSHSGPLIQGTVQKNFGKGRDDPHVVSSRGSLSTLSGFVASRTSSSEDHREKRDPSKLGAARQVVQYQESSHELVSTGKKDYKHNVQKVAVSPQGFSREDTGLFTRRPRGNKIYVSGPLLPSNDVDQMLKEQDRQIQEFARRTRLDKTKPAKGHSQRKQPSTYSMYVSRPYAL